MTGHSNKNISILL